MLTPKLRNVSKIPPPYPLGKFPANFIFNVGKEIVYLLCTKAEVSLEGAQRERIFAKATGAAWKPSNVGLDDVVLGNCAWSAKTVKGTLSQKRVRLIRGRNSPSYSFNEGVINRKADPVRIGHEVIAIWNARVESIRSRFPHMRTVVLIKSEDLRTLRIFEVDTKRYDAELYDWSWNKRGNLEGHREGEHCFTWQPHGSQFTIIENIPDACIDFRIKAVPKLDEEQVLNTIGFDSSWITLINEENT